MPETITVDHETGLIEVRSFGVVTADDLRASVEEVRRLRDLHGIAEVLVDVSEERSLADAPAAFEIVRTMPRQMKIAVIGSEQAATSSDVRFIETVAANIGLQVKIFESKKKALRWLKSS